MGGARVGVGGAGLEWAVSRTMRKRVSECRTQKRLVSGGLRAFGVRVVTAMCMIPLWPRTGLRSLPAFSSRHR